MPSSALPRALRAAAAFTFGAAAAFVLPTPASAADIWPQLDVPDTAFLAPGETGPSFAVRLIAIDGEADTIASATLSVDLSAFAGKVRFESPACAEESPAIYRCELTDTPWTPDGTELLTATLTADADTPADSSGRVEYTFSSPETEQTQTATRLTVGASLNLTSGGDIALSAAPGEGFPLPLSVANTGTGAVSGAVVTLNSEYSTPFTSRPANCEFTVDANHFHRTRCHFAGTLQPGADYTLSTPLTLALRPDTRAPGFAAVVHRWYTAADHAAENPDAGLDWVPGDGPAVSLVPTVAANAGAHEEPEHGDNDGIAAITVTGENGYDLTAVGGSATATPGTTVDAVVGVTNLGPATLSAGRSWQRPIDLGFTLPAGTTLLAVPDGCRAKGVDPTVNRPRYRCDPGYDLFAGATTTWTFRLRVNTVIPGASGAVRILDPRVSDSDVPMPPDLGPGNDTALFVLGPIARERHPQGNDQITPRPRATAPTTST
ncbi:hypothetical protein [Phytomonospora endophytica]|uniref:DUF11 domain-containing protein n=1 Tax=Phytomonospora endophytica TaxID=714109 RepID=A0A841FV86_9ACTN|nr:hypothetical protein [Phytomonospora endophytica]MBB6037452.1 hypothetical protein [Phytomonospora endophytica]GIG70702.1 hypothetical protein Pen01_69970 [Phytomonospora endophytica]